MPTRPSRRMPKKTMRKRRAQRGVRRVRRTNFNQPEWASMTEIIRGEVLESNTMYGASLIQLGQFKRASVVAQAYQEYRIMGATFRFTPRFDTFLATTDAATSLSVPYFYYMVDKLGALKAGASLAQLQSMGATPKRFDDKTIVVKYKPSVLQAVENGTVTPGATVISKPLTSPWLLTQTSPIDGIFNPSIVDHRGLWFYLDTKTLPGDGQYEYDVDIEVNIQYRKPLLPSSAGVSTKQGGNVLPINA